MQAQTAALFTRHANGIQAWPDDHTAIAIPVHCWSVEVTQNPDTKDGVVRVFTGDIDNDVALFIPRGGSVVIEALP